MPNIELINKKDIAIKLFKNNNENKHVAYGYIILSGLKITINIYKSDTGLKIQWPNYQKTDGSRLALVDPINQDCRREWAILINEELKKLESPEQKKNLPTADNINDSKDNWIG